MIKAFVEEKNGYMVGTIEGRLDTPATPMAEKGLAPLFSCDDKDIIIDCKDLTYIASSGLRLLLDILKNAKAHGHHVYMKNLSGNFREAFTLTGFIDLFEYM